MGSMDDLVARAKAKQAAMTPEQKAKVEALTSKMGQELTAPEKPPERAEDLSPGKDVDKIDMALMAIEELAMVVEKLARNHVFRAAF